MSDAGGGSGTTPTPGMSDSEGAGGGGRTTSASGLSRTSETSRTSLVAPTPTTTISTIAVQSGNTRIVIALLQSAEWLELRVVELTPGMVYLGSNLREASQLLHAHEEVLTKLQSKQSPVEDLLNQADQLISTQHPRAEVYAAMAESLGLAWKDLNSQLETRKQLLDMGVAFHTRAQQYSDSMDAAERAYTDNVMPNDAEGARQLLSSLHDLKRAILESSMYTLQEAQALLARLRGLSSEGATLDSRPLHIKTNIEFACSQIEHYLESLHDRRRFLDGLFSARKHHLEQCLSLCLLYQDLTEAVTALKQLRDAVSQHQGLGESLSNAEILLHEHTKREMSAKEQQDKCIRLLKVAENMASGGHYAGVEARSRAYSVLEAATALHETCDTRTALLQQSILFFKLAQTALTKLDQAEVQVAGLGGEGAQRLSLVLGVVEEAVQPALTEGYAILEVTGGRNQPHNMGISLMVEELERRRSHLSSVCVSSTEQVLQRTELSNAFLEQYNTIESWLVRIGDAFLQGHQDPGGSLSLARDFLHLHQTLIHDVMEKKNEINALTDVLEKLLPNLSAEEGAGYQEKMQALRDHWAALKQLLDLRIIISEKYVKFHEDAEAVNNEHEALELLLKEAKGEDRGAEVEAKWEQVQKRYLDLCNTGKEFCQYVRNVEDPYLDTNRAILCVETILEHLGKRRLVITDLHSHFHMKITTTKEMMILWKTYRENIQKMQFEMSQVENNFCPLLRGDTANPEGMADNLEQRLNLYVSAVKKTQEDIQNMMTRAEVMSYKGDEGGQRDEVIGSLLQLYQNLQNKATEYQILGHMLMQWCRNIAEIHRSCDKLESQFGNVSLDIGGVEGQIREHEASRQAVLELLKFAQNEADSIISKIKDQCPPEAGAQDIAVIEELLKRRGEEFEVVWIHHQHMLERQLKRSQYHVDLQVISDQLRDLSEQLSRMRGHYGDSLPAAKNMQTAFNQFQVTVDMLEKRIQTFVTTTTKMLGPDDDSGEIQEDLAELEKKWSTFQMQVGQSKKSIELSIVFYKLVEEAEDWVKQGSNLLVDVAGESASIQSPGQAEKLRSRIEHFLQPGEQAQQQRITKISSLALQLYGSAAPKQIEVVNHQNTQMIDSFTIINRNLAMMIENLRTAEEHREKQKKEKEELAASLAAAQAEAEAARLAATAAEEARKAAEEVAKILAIPIQPEVPKKVEIEIQTEAIPLPEKETPKQEDTPPPKKAKLIDEEPQHMPPVFLTPLVGATVTEGVKFSFECRVMGMPMPEVEWLKDNMSITANLDYKTSFEEGVCALTIEETFTEDSALFTCKAVNAAGIAETSATLTVKEAEPVEVLAPPSFTKRLVDSTAKEGSSFQLEATVEGHPLPVVSWSKDGNCVDESPDYVITFNNGECVLRFEEVFLEDKAEYSCKATNDLGEDITKAKLTVTAVEHSERPKFIMPLSNVMARAGQKFKLECHVTGLPAPTITWFHNSKPVKETLDCKIAFDGRIATLVMSEAFPKNAGTYTVVAKNSAGEGQCSANVSVKGRIPTETSDSEVTSDIDVEPVKPTVQLPLKDTNIKEGKTARLDCVIVGQPEPEVIWYHDDKPVKESNDFKLLFHGDRCSLIIQEAFLEDAGIYRVVAMNSAGEASTACFLNVEPTPELIVPPASEPPAVAPRFSKLLTDNHVTEGNPVTLRATVTGQPKPTIAWFRDGMPLIPDNELQIHESSDGSVSITIHATTLDHTGQYEIVASNSAGTASCLAYLSIEPRLPTPPPVEQTEPPVFTKLISDTTVTSGSSVKFEAEVKGLPTPTVYWTLNDCRITGQEYLRGHLQYVLGSSGNTHILELPTTSMMQSGRVAIVAENSVGRAVSAASLNIVELPVVEAKPVMPVVQQHTREESHVSSSTSSTTVFQKSSIVETSHVTKVASSDGPSDQKMHTMAATSTSHVKKATGEPTVEVHGSRLQEIRQEGGGPPIVADKVSMVKREGEIITQQISQDSSVMPVSPPAKKIFISKKKLTPARFLAPLQGVIARDDDEVILECVIDGYPDPSVTWTHNGGPLKDDAQVKTHLNKTTLIIPKVNQSHSGHYTCLIENDAGSAQCTCDVIIKKTQFPPVISKRLQPAVVGVNERLYLEIDVTGTPSPEISWTKNGQPIKASDHITLKSEGTRHILIIQQAEPGDSGRYGVIASNPAGRAESLADVMVTQLILDKAPPSHRIIFADVTDETKRNIESVEEGHVKTIKRAIEEVAVETPPSSSPVKILKASLPKPTFVSPVTTEALPPTPSTPQPPPPEPVSEEVEVRRPPGKLKMAWPPPPPDDQADRIPKIDTSVEITSCNVSSIISSFSASDEIQSPLVSQSILPKQPIKPKLPPKLPPEENIELQPEPEPEYGYISHLEQGTLEEPELQYEITPEEQPDTSHMPPTEQILVPEPEYDYQIIQSPEPMYVSEPYLETACPHEPEKTREVKVIEQLESGGQIVQEYKRISIPVSEPHKILSPVPEVVPEPVSSPEPCIFPDLEASKLPKQASKMEKMNQEFTPSDFEPIPKRDIITESSTKETSFYESKKSISKSSFSTVETKVYTTGISSPPEQPVKVTSEVTTQTVAPDLVPQPTSLGPAVESVIPESVISLPSVISEPVIPELIVEASTQERPDTEAKDLKPSPENGPLEYFVPEKEEVIEFIPSPLPVSAKPEIISKPEKSVSEWQLPPKSDEIHFEKHSEYGSHEGSSQMSSFSSISSERQTYISSSDVQTKLITAAPLKEPGVLAMHDNKVPQSKRPKPLIMPESKVTEQAGTEETIKPPKPPERDEVKEQKKPKKKRESVIQLAKRLEETIVPMSPDDVPGGIRMFPSPKQPSTPVRDVPASLQETTEDRADTDFKTEKFPELQPFPFTVEERPRRERPRSLPPPMPSKFIPGTFTDSEYESDMEPEQRIRLKKIKFEVPEPAPRPVSVGRDPIPPSVFDTPPVFQGGMRPEILKKEEVVKEKPKVVTPRKKAKIVEKFLASAGASAEQDIVKPVPEKSKKNIAPLPAKVAHEKIPPTKEWPLEPQPQLTQSVKTDSVSVIQQPLPSGGSLKQTSTASSFSETKRQITSVSYQTKQTKITEHLHHIPTSEVVPEPTPVLVPEPAPEYVLQPEPAPEYVFQPEHESDYDLPPEPSTVCDVQPEPVHICDLQPEPAPEYAREPEPTPDYVIEPEPAPEYVTVPEPAPEYIIEPEPVIEPEPAPEPVIEPEPAPVIEPEPAPEYVIEPEPAPEYVTEQWVESTSVPGFRSVQAPSSKHDQIESSPAPSLPFSIAPELTVDSKSETLYKAKPVLVIEATQELVRDKVDKEIRKPAIRPVKKPEPPSQSVTRPLWGSKKVFVWPPKSQDEASSTVSSSQIRSQSAERPQVSEAIILPERPHEAPPAIYWSSNITLQEKRTSWPQAGPQVQAVTSSTVLESSSVTSKQEMVEMSQRKSQTCIKKHVEKKAPTIGPQKSIQTSISPSVQKVQDIRQKKEILVKTPAPPRESSVVSPIIQLPPLEPFPFTVEPEKEKKPRGKAPPVPKKFVPGSFTESEYESDYDSKAGSFSRLYMSDSEATGYRPMNIKMKKGRTKKPKQPSPPPPSALGAPPFETKLLPLSLHFSDIDSDIQTSRESTPVPGPVISQSKHIVHSTKSLVSQITSENKPIEQKTTIITPAVTPKAAPFTPIKPAPKVAPKEVPLTSKAAPCTTSEPAKKQAPPITKESSAPGITVRTEVQDLHSETLVQTTEKKERGVLGMRKIFEGSGPAPMPQGVQVISRTPGLSSIRVQSPSPVRSGPLSPSVRLTSPTGVAPIQVPAPTPKTVPTPPVSDTSVRIIPVVQEDGAGKTLNSNNAKTKPSSPKSRKKIDTPQMTAQELEESGYAADTEGTLPRRSAKTTQSMNSSSFASTSSFSKSETIMSSSFSKTESKSFVSSESGKVEPPSFPSDFSFAASGGLPPETNFPSGSFPFPFTPASSVGQTSHCSSSFKSSESKSSQMFTSRSEEIHEERRGSEGPKTAATTPPPPQKEKKRPKFEEYRRDTQGKPGTSGPFSEDTYYAMKDESDETTDNTRTQKKVELKSETHVEIMSDKKVEVFESTSVDVTPQPSKKQVLKVEQKIDKKAIEEPALKKPQVSKPVKSPEETSKQAFQDVTRENLKTVVEVSEHERVTKKETMQSKTTGKSKTEKMRETPHLASEPTDKPSKKSEHEKSIKESKVTLQAKVPEIEPLKSTGLVKQAVTKHEREKEELDLKPFPFNAEPEKPKKPRGAPPPQPVKFVKGEFLESDYESDYEGYIQPKWNPTDSDAEVYCYGQIKAPLGTCKTSQSHVRTPTPPTAFDEPPHFDGPPRPKIDFPESETEPEREVSPEIIIPEKVQIVSHPKPPTVVPKEPKIFRSQPQEEDPSLKRSPSPVLKPGSPPVEDYIPPPSQPSPFSNAVGVESTKITKIADSSKHHQRFVTMQQTTRVIKFTDARTATTTTTKNQQAKAHESRPLQKKEHEQKPLPPLEPFPFSPEPAKAKKDRGAPPPKPKKFHKSEFNESDYESDFEGRIKPKWQPSDSDAEDPSYKKVKPSLLDKTCSKTRERTPTPPTVFDTPPKTGEPWRPNVEPPKQIPQKEQSPKVIIPKEPPKKSEQLKVIVKAPKKLIKHDERPYSPPLPSPGPTPEEGIIVQETQYVVDKVDLKSRVIAPPMREVQTYEDKPYKKITERTEKIITNLKMEEELKVKKERTETKKTVTTEFEQVPEWPPPSTESEEQFLEIERFPDLEPFPFEPDKDRPKRDRGQPPPKPKKFVKGGFRESDYDSDYEGKVRPKWKPADSDAEDPEYTSVRPPQLMDRDHSKSKERTPTPPTKFEIPPQSGGPLRPIIDPVDKPVLIVKETSPEIIIPKVKEQPLAKVAKVTPKAPVLKPKEPEPQMPKIPTPPLPEPGPQPEIGYVQVKALQTEEKEDAHIRMIKKKTEAKKGFQIDIDITDIYDFVSESDHDKADTELNQNKPFPQLEPFPYEPDPSRPKRQRGPPPPQPKKFLKGEFRGSDYESDYEKPIAPKWVPPDSESEERVYRKVAPPTGETGKQRSESLGRDPSPPSKFDQPPQFEGPPRPVMELSDLPRRERRESLEEYSIPRFPKVEFKPFDLEDDVADHPQGAVTTDTETEPELHTKGGIDRKYVKSAQKAVSHQFEDMTQTFRHKAQKFAEQLVTEVFAAREGSVPAEPAGEPPSLPEELKTQSISPDSTAIPPTTTAGYEALSPSTQEPQAYRDESRVSEFGTKHIDPDTGLIYFKYDFGYEFGVVLPGEAKKVEKKKVNGDHSHDIPIPVIHEKTEASTAEKSTAKTNGHVHHLEVTSPRDPPTAEVEESTPGKGSSIQVSGTDHVSPQPSLQSDISETDREYQQYMGKMVPEFVPKKQAQFRPISGDPYSDSEAELDHPSPSKITELSPGIHVGPKRFVPLVPGAAVQPKTLPFQGSPADALCTTTDLGATPRPDGNSRRATASRVRGSGRSTCTSDMVQRGHHSSERARPPDRVQKRCL